MPIAEGAVSWNGFLKQVGFNPPTVYEVSDTVVIPAGEMISPSVTLLCLEGDWANVPPSPDPLDVVTNPFVKTTDFTHSFIQAVPGTLSKAVGLLADVTIQQQVFDVEVTITILCFSPSTFQTVGGEWQATDTTALIIGYSVLNAYWLAPIGIGIGVGIYLVKRKF